MLENILDIIEKIAGIFMIIIVVGFICRRVTIINNRKDNSKEMMRKG